jgi:FlaA1/EpsC-like NDP-sugar epimerase
VPTKDKNEQKAAFDWGQGSIFIIQTLLIPLSYYIAFHLRFDFDIPFEQFDKFLKTLPIIVVVRLITFYYMDMFDGWWRYVSIEDLTKIAMGVVVSSVCFILSVVFIYGLTGFPRSVFIMDTIFIYVMLGGVRIITRLVIEKYESAKHKGEKKNILIAGAGRTGITVLNEIRSNNELHLNPVGFIDDDPAKKGHRIRNLPILGTHHDIPALVKLHNIDEILISMPSALFKDLQEIFKSCDKANISYKTLPGISKVLGGKTFVSQMRDVKPDELLGRPAVSFNNRTDPLTNDLTGETILVTGAGGSIGSELCRQIAEFRPKTLIMYERNENNLYYKDIEIEKKVPGLKIVSVIGDILNRNKFARILKKYKPSIIYHAAAYKHVPLMERDPAEAVRNNFFGSKVLSDLCVEYNVKKVVFISTDKAVNPSSVMGSTKRMTEKLLQTYKNTSVKFISVRFGNVIGSSGSVIPLFKKQLSTGGPITVTHPETTRFLMTIPEAVHLVLLAGSMGSGKEIYLLDMGKPANITKLAEHLIELSGLTPYKDINIEFIGLREGEKLHEELYWEGEDILPTRHNKIKCLNKTDFDISAYEKQTEEMNKLIGEPEDNRGKIRQLLKKMVPEATISKQKAH